MNSGRKKYFFLIISLTAALFFKAVVFEFYRVSSDSMSDTILSGDFVLINRVVFGTITPNRANFPVKNYGFNLPSFRIPALRDIRQGEIVVIRNRYYPGTGNDLIKRIAAVPGQEITVMNGFIFVDGLLHETDYYDDDFFIPEEPEIEIFTIPSERYFVIGDNSVQSFDSRDFGLVKKEDILGKVSLIYASFDSSGSARWNRFFRIPE